MRVQVVCATLAALVAIAHAQVHYIPAFIPAYAFNQTQNATIFNHTTSSGDVVQGQIGLHDRLLYSQSYFKPRRWYSTREKVIEYPNDLPDWRLRHEVIGAIRIYNKFYDGLDSKAEILRGGVGGRYVKIRLTSNWGKGFKYLVQIFGH